MFQQSRIGQVDRPIWSQSSSRYKSGGNASRLFRKRRH
uniref:Uncharacterized protein n=1 Tax=Utricularia reniformis TaxID=192314 RepID=A0A1Y0B2E1_9LAMI|nr:hypothetical protein AEK19_MT1319 [Utricularia reniformis]ART31519.1 hypothetical protein AEK19_MT1319 [Utricularia reniformis]